MSEVREKDNGLWLGYVVFPYVGVYCIRIFLIIIIILEFELSFIYDFMKKEFSALSNLSI